MKKVLTAFLLIFVGYLFHACVAPRLAIGGISPNILMAVIAIATVAYSRFYTFAMAAIAGILTEVMMPGLIILNAVLYPAIAFLGSLLFADKSERRREQEVAAGKSGKDMHPLIRTVLCVAFNMFIFDGIHLAYNFLNGAESSMSVWAKPMGSILYTIAITIIIMLPVRYMIGMYPRRRKERKMQEKLAQER